MTQYSGCSDYDYGTSETVEPFKFTHTFLPDPVLNMGKF